MSSNLIMEDATEVEDVIEDDDMMSSVVEEVAPKAERLDADMLQMLDNLTRLTKRCVCVCVITSVVCYMLLLLC